MRIAFLITDYNISGGMNIIAGYAAALARQGHAVTFVAENPLCGQGAKHFSQIACCRHIDFATARAEFFDIAVITFWRLILRLHHIKARRFVPFIQRLEYEPYPPGRIRDFISAAMTLPLATIGVSSDIKSKMEHLTGYPCALALNGIDKNIFRPDGRCAALPDPAKLRVLVEGPLSVPFKNVAAAIAAARAGGADEVWLLTSTPVTAFPGVDRVFSQIPQSETAAIYRSCQLLVKMSLVEGMCLPPLEMFHCGGTAVMYDLPPVHDYAIDGENSLLCAIGDSSAVIRGVAALKKDPAWRRKLSAQAVRTAEAWPDLTDGAAVFAAELARLHHAALDEEGRQPEILPDFIRRLKRRYFGCWCYFLLRSYCGKVRRNHNFFTR